MVICLLANACAQSGGHRGEANSPAQAISQLLLTVGLAERAAVNALYCASTVAPRAAFESHRRGVTPNFAT